LREGGAGRDRGRLRVKAAEPRRVSSSSSAAPGLVVGLLLLFQKGHQALEGGLAFGGEVGAEAFIECVEGVGHDVFCSCFFLLSREKEGKKEARNGDGGAIDVDLCSTETCFSLGVLPFSAPTTALSARKSGYALAMRKNRGKS
jgi:hypothetical protein